MSYWTQVCIQLPFYPFVLGQPSLRESGDFRGSRSESPGSVDHVCRLWYVASPGSWISELIVDCYKYQNTLIRQR